MRDLICTKSGLGGKASSLSIVRPILNIGLPPKSPSQNLVPCAIQRFLSNHRRMSFGVALLFHVWSPLLNYCVSSVVLLPNCVSCKTPFQFAYFLYNICLCYDSSFCLPPAGFILLISKTENS